MRYPDINDRSYTSIIDEKSYKRLRATLEDAERRGARLVPLVPGATWNDALRKTPPHLVPPIAVRLVDRQLRGPGRKGQTSALGQMLNRDEDFQSAGVVPAHHRHSLSMPPSGDEIPPRALGEALR